VKQNRRKAGGRKGVIAPKVTSTEEKGSIPVGAGAAIQARHWEGIVFEYVHPLYSAENYTGTVIKRPEAMVLEIDHGKYLVVGDSEVRWFDGVGTQLFQGKNTGSGGDGVFARWAFVGKDDYVGIWIQDNDEWLFRFRLKGPGRLV
jgi:hypothetical protein